MLRYQLLVMLLIFGNLLAATDYHACHSDGTKLFSAGGDTGGGQNVIQYVTISTTGNAADWGRFNSC